MVKSSQIYFSEKIANFFRSLYILYLSVYECSCVLYGYKMFVWKHKILYICESFRQRAKFLVDMM